MAFASRAGMKALLCALLALSAAGPLRAADGWWETVKDTTPYGLADEAERAEGYWHGLRAGSASIARDGRWELLLSGYAWHEEGDRYNEKAWGLGIARRVTDARGNERLLYALASKDSYSKPQYLAGYAWLARWPLGEKLQFGAGYTAFLMARSKYGPGNYIPFPGVLPVASLGTERMNLMATYVPAFAGGNVLFVFGRIGF